jgi:hypothetical protein
MTDVVKWVDDIQANLDEVRRLLATPGDPAVTASLVAGTMADVHRASARGLYAAVTAAHDLKVSWRRLAPYIKVKYQTLHDRWSSGGGRIVLDGNPHPKPKRSTPEDNRERLFG